MSMSIERVSCVGSGTRGTEEQIKRVCDAEVDQVGVVATRLPEVKPPAAKWERLASSGCIL